MQQRPRIVTLTWGIPAHIGGMTGTALERSALFRSAGYACETIVFSPVQSRAADDQRLTAEGRLPAAGRLLNLWDILAAATLPPPARSSQARPTPLGPDAEGWTEAGVVRVRTRYAADGVTPVQRDHYRPDGTLLAVDARGDATSSAPRQRRVTLFDTSGATVRSWGGIWPLYRFALEGHLDGDPAVLFYDSKITSKFASAYRRPGIATVHVIHNRHLAQGAACPFGPLADSRASVLHNLEGFDRVVCSTAAQRADLEALLAHPGLVRVIPPAIARSVAAWPMPEGAGRRPYHGVVLSSPEPRKRLDDLVRAVALARDRLPELTLDIFGPDAREWQLQGLIEREGLRDVVRLCGYQAEARAEFARASWTALTSTHEGFGMAIAEALASGCLPLAYDVAYGPGEILQDLPDCLTLDETPEALADRLVWLHELPAAERARMRASGQESARRFHPDTVRELWCSLVRWLEPRLAAAAELPPAPQPLSLRARTGPRGLEIEAEYGLRRDTPLPPVALGMATGDPEIEWRILARSRRLAGNRYRARALLPVAEFPRAVERAAQGPTDLVAVVGEHGPRAVIGQGVVLSESWGTVSGVRGARRWIAALRRRLTRRKP